MTVAIVVYKGLIPVVGRILTIRHLRELSSLENVQWDGSSDSSCI